MKQKQKQKQKHTMISHSLIIVVLEILPPRLTLRALRRRAERRYKVEFHTRACAIVR